jgi:hypothetical protein
VRTRLIRPEFFGDSTIADLDDGCRLFFIGLWCLADDTGTLTWKPREIGAALYPYRSEDERLPQIERWTSELVDRGRVRLLECGLHALVPTLPKHRQKGGRLASNVSDAHTRTCKHIPVRPVRTENENENENENESGTYRSFRDLVGPIIGHKEAADVRHGGRKGAQPSATGEHLPGGASEPGAVETVGVSAARSAS